MKDLEATKARQAASKEKWSTRSGKRVGTGYTIVCKPLQYQSTALNLF
jgi:hypothetical protein